jgi:hypothetical protein
MSPSESFGQVLPVGSLRIIRIHGIAVCCGLEDEGFIEGFVHVCIHTFGCWEDEEVSGHDDSYEVCIHTFNEREGLGHEGTSGVCIHTYPKLRVVIIQNLRGLDN